MKRRFRDYDIQFNMEVARVKLITFVLPSFTKVRFTKKLKNKNYIKLGMMTESQNHINEKFIELG